MSETLQPLLDKLEAAKFSGELNVRFDAGQISGGTLIHLLPFSDLLGRELVTIEPEKKCLKACVACKAPE